MLFLLDKMPLSSHSVIVRLFIKELLIKLFRFLDVEAFKGVYIDTSYVNSLYNRVFGLLSLESDISNPFFIVVFLPLIKLRREGVMLSSVKSRYSGRKFICIIYYLIIINPSLIYIFD